MARRAFGRTARVVAAIVAVPTLCIAAVVVRDARYFASRCGPEEACWKALFFAPTKVAGSLQGMTRPAGPTFERSARELSRNVFVVDLEMDLPREGGGRVATPVRCTVECESFDLWRLREIQVGHEPAVVYDDRDGPTGQANHLWGNRIARFLGIE